MTYDVFERDGVRVPHSEWASEQNYLSYHPQSTGDREADEKRQKEDRWCKQLDGLISDWEKAMRVRRFAEACRTAVEYQKGPYTTAAEFRDWLTWVAKFADGLDPTASLKLPGVKAMNTE